MVIIMLGLVAISCFFSIIFIQVKYRQIKACLPVEPDTATASRIGLLAIVSIEGIFYAILVAVFYFTKPELSARGQNMWIFIVITILFLAATLIKGIIAGLSIKDILTDSGRTVFSKTLLKQAMAETLNIVGLVLFLCLVIK